MPTVLRWDGYRFYFYSHEGAEPPHIHIDKAGSSAKFWLDPGALARSFGFQIIDNAYKQGKHTATVKAGENKRITLKLAKSFSWYDFTLKITGAAGFERRCAGRVETAKPGFSDPAMGGAS